MASAVNQSINVFNVLGGNWDPRSSVQWIHTDKICFLHAKHSLRKPPHAWFTQSHKICSVMQTYHITCKLRNTGSETSRSQVSCINLWPPRCWSDTFDLLQVQLAATIHQAHATSTNLEFVWNYVARPNLLSSCHKPAGCLPCALCLLQMLLLLPN